MIVRVKVKPGSKEEKVERISDYEYKIEVREPAEDGQANSRVINLLSKELGISYKRIILKNPKSREKLFEIIDDK